MRFSKTFFYDSHGPLGTSSEGAPADVHFRCQSKLIYEYSSESNGIEILLKIIIKMDNNNDTVTITSAYFKTTFG